MQYGILVVIIIAVIIFVAVRAIRFRIKFKNLFTELNEQKIIASWKPYSNTVGFSSYKNLWLKASKNINCPEGKMLNDMKLSELQSSYPFSEMLLDDLLDGIDHEERLVFDKDEYFSALIAKLGSIQHQKPE